MAFNVGTPANQQTGCDVWHLRGSPFDTGLQQGGIQPRLTPARGLTPPLFPRPKGDELVVIIIIHGEFAADF